MNIHFKLDEPRLRLLDLAAKLNNPDATLGEVKAAAQKAGVKLSFTVAMMTADEQHQAARKAAPPEPPTGPPPRPLHPRDSGPVNLTALHHDLSRWPETRHLTMTFLTSLTKAEVQELDLWASRRRQYPSQRLPNFVPLGEP